MVDVGLIGEDERLELIGGELVPMSPKGSRHEVVKVHLARALRALAGAQFDVVVETTLRLEVDTYVEPDLTVVAVSTKVRDYSPATALLVIEIADSSLGYDLGRKPVIYAAHGLPELWVVDVATRQTHVHRDPGPTGYRSVIVAPASAAIAPLRLLHVSVTLESLPLDE